MKAHIRFSAPLSTIAIAVSVALGLILGLFTHPAPSGGLSVQVDGNFAGPVNVHASGSITAKQEQTLIKGTGREIAQDGQVLVRISNFSYTNAGYMEILNAGVVKAGSATKSDLQQLYSLIVGGREGSRLMAVIPNQALSSAEIVVVDVLPTLIQGDVRPTSHLPGGISLSVDAESGIPTVAGDGQSISSTQVAVAIPGSGEQISAKNAIYANYLIADTAGKVRESTYQNPAPAYIQVSEVFPGLAQALSEQRVGSRIIATVPSAQARGDGDLVVVLDILACGEKEKNDGGSAGHSVS